MDIWLDIEGSIKQRQIEVLYVRWMALLTDHKLGMNCADHDTFGFLDPS